MNPYVKEYAELIRDYEAKQGIESRCLRIKSKR